MTEEATNGPPPGRTRRRWRFWLLAAGGVFCLAVLGAALFLQSSLFEEMVRSRLVTALERATGGRAELEGFTLNLTRLQADLRGLTLHGREGPQEPPLFHAELAQVGWSLFAVWDWPVWSWRAELRLVRLWNPQVYVAAYEDGQSNLPLAFQTPPGATAGEPWAARVLALGIGELEVLRGQFRWNENRIPLDFRVDNFRTELDYDPAENRYSGKIEYQQGLLQSPQGNRLPSWARAEVSLTPQRAEVASFVWETPGSRLSAGGVVENFRSPQLDFHFDLRLDGKEAAEWWGRSGWEGILAWRGDGGYSAQGWRMEGGLEINAAQVGNELLRAVPWSARSTLRVARPAPENGEPPAWSAQFEELEVTALGGTASGSASIQTGPPSPEVILDVNTSRISLPVLARNLSALHPPLSSLNWAGAISGPMRLRFVSDHLEVGGDWRIETPLALPPGFVPVSGVLRGSYSQERGVLEIDESFLDLPRSRFGAKGTLGGNDPLLTTTIDSASLADCESLAKLLGKTLAGFPVALRGRVQAEALLSGAMDSPTIRGGFQVTDFSIRDTAWDGLSGALLYESVAEATGASALPGSPQDGSSRSMQSKLTVSSGRLWKGDAAAEFSGSLGLQDGGWIPESALSLRAALRNMAIPELQRLAGLDYPVEGDLEASLSATGTLRVPAIEGEFEINGFAYDGKQWEGASGKLRYQQAPGPADVRRAKLSIESGRVWKGNADVRFGGALELEDASWTPHGAFTLEASLQDVDLSDIQEIAGLSLPLQGRVEGNASLGGTREDPQGQGSITWTDVAAYGESFDSLTAQVALKPGHIIVAEQVHLQKSGEGLRGEGFYNTATRQYQFALRGENISIEKLDALDLPAFPLSGVALAEFSGSGTLDRPSLRGRLEIDDLRLGDQGEGSLSFGLETEGGKARFTLRSKLLDSVVEGSGEALLQDDFPLTARLRFENLSAFRLSRDGRPAPEGFRARGGGTALVEGPLRDPGKIQVRAEVSRVDAAVGPVEFSNQQPWRVDYQDGLLTLGKLELAGKDVSLEAEGTLRLASDTGLHLAIRGLLNLAMMQVLAPDLAVTGPVRVDGTLDGSLDNPLWQGRLEVSGGDLRYGTLPNGLSNIQGTLVVEENRGTLENFTAESGGGRIGLGGWISYAGETGFQLQITADAAGVRVRYPEGISTLLDGQLNLTGSPEGSLLSGGLVIRQETVSPRFDLAAALLRGRNQAGTASDSSFLQNTRLEIEVVSAPDIRVETAVARNLGGEIDLRLQGTLDNPSVLGRIGIRQGELSFAGTSYTVNRGEITFLNPFRVEPVLSLNMQTRVQQYDISLEFSGPADRLSVTYRSDPPLATDAILNLLAAGGARTPSLNSTPSATTPELGADTILSQALASQLSNRLDRVFGTGGIRIDPQIAGFGQAANASVAFEQQVSDNLRFLYVTNVTSAQQQLIQAEWSISPRLSVVIIRDQNGLVGVNFQLKLRFR